MPIRLQRDIEVEAIERGSQTLRRHEVLKRTIGRGVQLIGQLGSGFGLSGRSQHCLSPRREVALLFR
jgi:hypothetical protein